MVGLKQSLAPENTHILITTTCECYMGKKEGRVFVEVIILRTVGQDIILDYPDGP